MAMVLHYYELIIDQISWPNLELVIYNIKK